MTNGGDFFISSFRHSHFALCVATATKSMVAVLDESLGVCGAFGGHGVATG
jgi:hypothetical protein